jgi:hypothetical protein
VGFAGGFVDCGCFGFVFCVGVPGVDVCVFACFFSSASARAEKLHDDLKIGPPLYILNSPKQLNALTDVKRMLHDVLKTP